jgi:peptidoglycan/LPS O-acetylase OafA/YrhL
MNQASSNLDILRSAAVLLVFFDHLLVVLGFDQTPALKKWGVESIGHFGVFMFFIHTSLVLMFSLERLRQAEPRALLRRFYIRRAFRIYPLSILVIVLALVLSQTCFLSRISPDPVL